MWMSIAVRTISKFMFFLHWVYYRSDMTTDTSWKDSKTSIRLVLYVLEKIQDVLQDVFKYVARCLKTGLKTGLKTDIKTGLKTGHETSLNWPD